LIKVLVICNPFAGGGTSSQALALYRSFAENLTSHSFSFYNTEGPGDYDGINLAVEAFQPNVVSVVGGDGTINEVLNVESCRLCDIHLVPAGSGNDFHRLVYGNINCKQSIEQVCATGRTAYDIGICNDRYFLNGVGIGFDGNVARETMRMKLPFISSKWKYWVAIFKNIFLYRSIDVSIEIEGKTENQRMFMIAIANGTDYGGGFRISPESDAKDGLLDIVKVEALSPIKRLFNIPKVQAGRHLSESFVSHRRIKQVVVKSKEIIHAHLDGEQMSGKQFSIEIKPAIPFVV
jgi:diacylglycerol kinase (ATP)